MTTLQQDDKLKNAKDVAALIAKHGVITNLEAVQREEITNVLINMENWAESKAYQYLATLAAVGARVARNTYNLKMLIGDTKKQEADKQEPVKSVLPKFKSDVTDSHLIPTVDENFVKFGNYDTIEAVIDSGKFAPIWITGLSGNGKTYSVEQACANLKREVIMINISNETNEEDLIGSFSLETVNAFEVEADEADYDEFLKWMQLQAA